ncbi:uncharacterized protein LOC125682311 isoform X2 [Ostrea edulis]|uniref:uncharacterized protein LOC125682311 isoform X2 n=1 Tax=Ostrea edulis TaxID=37623 RepID=UPI0020946EC6|nr:uncharacterized protein LOC125682311 isoform X2 [Ostrea edulis]
MSLISKMSTQKTIPDFILLISILSVFEMTCARPEITALSPLQVTEYREIKLQCTVAPSMNITLRWTWWCAGKKMKDDNGGLTSTMTFSAKREHDETWCYCRAQSETSKIKYDEISNLQTVTVYYLPRDNPHLVALSLTSLAVGHDFILQCSISTLGNPPLSWFWTCGQKNISHGRMSVFNMSSSKIVFEAEAWQNKMSCFCTAVSSKYNFRALSNEVKITVYYGPLDYPELINKSLLHVEKGSSVTLRCHVSSEGNPRLYWSWHCGKLLMEKEVTYGDTWSELTFVASQQFNQRACYCRLSSMSEIIRYNKVSQKMFITIKDGQGCISFGIFASTTSVLSGIAGIAFLVIIMQNVRKKPKKLRACRCFGSLFRDSRRTVQPSQPKLRQNQNRATTFIEAHTYEAVQPPTKKSPKERKRRKKWSPLYENFTKKM